MANKLNVKLKERVLRVDLTKLEASLIRKLREVPYGELNFRVHMIEGQPVRIEMGEIRSSDLLDANYGMDLEDCVYISPNEKN
jgi:hypothetical protein